MGGGHASGKLLAVTPITVPPGFTTATKQLLAHPAVERHTKGTIRNATAPSLCFSDNPRNKPIIGKLSNTEPAAGDKAISLLVAGIS